MGGALNGVLGNAPLDLLNNYSRNLKVGIFERDVMYGIGRESLCIKKSVDSTHEALGMVDVLGDNEVEAPRVLGLIDFFGFFGGKGSCCFLLCWPVAELGPVMLFGLCLLMSLMLF